MAENSKPRRDDQGSIDGDVFSRLIAANAFWPESSHRQMMAMVDQILTTDRHIQQITGTCQGIDIQGGFVAEEMHAETFNLNSALQEKSAKALTDKYGEWQDAGLAANDKVADIVVVDHGQIKHKAQSKYYQSAKSTADRFRETRDGKPKYKDTDSMIGPSDQVHPADGKPSIADEAHKTEMKNAAKRPEVAEAAGQVRRKVTDKLKSEGCESKPISKHETREVAKNSHEGKSFRRGYQDGYMTRSTLRQIRRAAGGAAGMAALMAGTLSTVRYLCLVREGKITTDEAIWGVTRNTAAAAADSALKAAAATGVVSVATRISAGTVAQQAVNSMLGRGAIAGGALCVVDLVQCMVLVAAGRMTPAEMETRAGKNILQTAGGVWGSSVGMSVAASLGATGGAALAFAGLAGGLIAGVAVTIAVENHIEAPYREVMANTAALESVGEVMRGTAEAMAYGQKAFGGFLVINSVLDQAMEDQLTRLDLAGQAMNGAMARLQNEVRRV